MKRSLERLFSAVEAPTGGRGGRAVYAVTELPGHEGFFVGKDTETLACLLIATRGSLSRPAAPIRLARLEAAFDLPCELLRSGAAPSTGSFTVLTCRSRSQDVKRYFLSLCAALARTLGDHPSTSEVSRAVHRVASIFRASHRPTTQVINGLFGELYVIARSPNPVRTLKAWRMDETARYDFVDVDVRIEVKTTSRRTRIHTFTYEQCNPPLDAIAVVASMVVERVAGGVTLGSIIDDIEDSVVASSVELVMKLHEMTLKTLGAGLGEAVSIAFDEPLARSALRFYDAREIPAIRGDLPTAVGGVKFHSDLSDVAPLSVSALDALSPAFAELLPRQHAGGG